jgi:alpha-galactosidase
MWATPAASPASFAPRTIPVMVDIARDMERLCPRGSLLNYTNPMAMLCRAIDRTTSIAVTGLCHSVQGTAEMLARWIGRADERDQLHLRRDQPHGMVPPLRVEWTGRLPLIRKAITERPEVYNEEQVRNEMFLAFDHYVTESSGHNSEYNWWFRKRPDLIERYCTHGTGWNPGEHAYILKHYQEREQSWQGEIQKWLAQPGSAQPETWPRSTQPTL